MTSIPKPEKRAPRPRKRISRTSKPRQRSRKRASVEARDRAWSLDVRERAGNCCERCGMSREALAARGLTLDAHHRLSKRVWPELRHMRTNGVALCRCCHQWAHANPDDFRAWGLAHPAPEPR